MLNTWCTYTKSGDVYTVREVWNVTDPSDGLVNRADNRFPKAVANSASTVANGTDLAQTVSAPLITPYLPPYSRVPRSAVR